MMPNSRSYVFLCVILVFLLAGCQSPCEAPLAAGYTRHLPQPGGAAFRFDYPSDWEAQDDLRLEKPDASGAGRAILVQIYAAPIEKYPHIYCDGKILSGQEWGSPFPGRSLQIGTKKLNLDGHPGLTVSFDFDSPLTLMDGTSPVTAWGYMQFTFLVVDTTMYDIRFYASDQGEEKLIRKEFDKLVNSICVLSQSEATND
jgi:hypothetical protein